MGQGPFQPIGGWVLSSFGIEHLWAIAKTRAGCLSEGAGPTSSTQLHLNGANETA